MDRFGIRWARSTNPTPLPRPRTVTRTIFERMNALRQDLCQEQLFTELPSTIKPDAEHGGRWPSALDAVH
jgi:hypothetical protein